MKFEQFEAIHPINIESISSAQSVYKKIELKIMEAFYDIARDHGETVLAGQGSVTCLSTKYYVQHKLVRAKGFDILGYIALVGTESKELSKVYFNNSGEALDPENNFEPIGKNINDDSHFLAVYLLKQAIPFQEG